MTDEMYDAVGLLEMAYKIMCTAATSPFLVQDIQSWKSGYDKLLRSLEPKRVTEEQHVALKSDLVMLRAEFDRFRSDQEYRNEQVVSLIKDLAIRR